VTDSGLGGVIVHDLATGLTLRRLSENRLMKQSPALPMRSSGGGILQDASGKRPEVGSDMIEISPDGRWLYVSTPTGPFYRIPTALLDNAAVSEAKLAAAIEEVAAIPTQNGTAMDTLGNLYLADAEHRRIEVLAPSGQRAVLVADERLINPDAIFIDQQRRLYVPATQNERLPEHAGGRDLIARPFLTFSMPLPETIGGIRLGSAIAPMLATGAVPDHSLPRGIEHVGFTVPDHDAAVQFLQRAFGAQTLYSLVKKGGAPLGADVLGSKNGLASGTPIVAVTLLRLGNGSNVEVFEISAAKGDGHPGISDFGISHFSLTVDDMDATTARFAEAGGTLLEGPYDLSGAEAGAGNRGRFGRTPWGLLIEFESFASPLSYEGTAERWLPKRAVATSP
jgi:catechol 2,3-dioxygenase-like lactoylglutathione lyase family enzyme